MGWRRLASCTVRKQGLEEAHYYQIHIIAVLVYDLPPHIHTGLSDPGDHPSLFPYFIYVIYCTFRAIQTALLVEL